MKYLKLFEELHNSIDDIMDKLLDYCDSNFLIVKIIDSETASIVPFTKKKVVQISATEEFLNKHERLRDLIYEEDEESTGMTIGEIQVYVNRVLEPIIYKKLDLVDETGKLKPYNENRSVVVLASDPNYWTEFIEDLAYNQSTGKDDIYPVLFEIY